MTVKYFWLIISVQRLLPALILLPVAACAGGGAEAGERVNLPHLLAATALFLLGLGTFFGAGLALVARRFYVEKDQRVDEVLESLAHAHCGACGYAGCEQYAEAVVHNPSVAPNLCPPGGKTAAQSVAKITGKKLKQDVLFVARVMCGGGRSTSSRIFAYEGIKDCRAAVLETGGDKECPYGCLGYGTCAAVCPFGAITMNSERLPVFNFALCAGCKKCVVACPRKVIEVLPLKCAVLIACHSNDKGGAVKKYCKTGCIGCGLCAKACPASAITVENNLARMELMKCTNCGACIAKCPTGAIKRLSLFQIWR